MATILHDDMQDINWNAGSITDNTFFTLGNKYIQQNAMYNTNLLYDSNFSYEIKTKLEYLYSGKSNQSTTLNMGFVRIYCYFNNQVQITILDQNGNPIVTEYGPHIKVFGNFEWKVILKKDKKYEIHVDNELFASGVISYLPSNFNGIIYQGTNYCTTKIDYITVQTLSTGPNTPSDLQGTLIL